MPDVPVPLLVVGAGPAGVSAALRARACDIPVRVLEAEAEPGGQLHRIHFPLEDVAGVHHADGAALAAIHARQLGEASIDLRTGARAGGLAATPPDAGIRVTLDDGSVHEARAVIVATGQRRRRLGVPGEAEFEGHGVSDSATKDRDRFAGRHVTVVGGGDAGFENALILRGAGCRVLLVVRGEAHARAQFRSRVRADEAIEVAEHTSVTAILGDDSARAVALHGPEGETERRTDGVVVKVGNLPNTEWCRSVLAHDAEGYLVAGPDQATSLPGVWAAGEVVRSTLPSIAVSVAQGALAVAAFDRARG